MTDKEKLEAIKAEIEKYKKLIGDPLLSDNDLIIGERNAINHVLKIINSLPEEPVSKDLEEVSKEYADKNYAEWLDFVSGDERDDHYPISEAFKAGAQWQKQKLVAWLTRESDFIIQELKKGNKAYGLPEQYRAQLYKEIVNKLKEE